MENYFTIDITKSPLARSGGVGQGFSYVSNSL